MAARTLGFRCLAAIAFAAAPARLPAQTTAPPATAAAPLAEQLARRVADYEAQSKAATGVCVVALPSGRQEAAIRERQLFTPASNQKLLTAAFALARLGEDFRFETVVWALPEGELLVAGDYDPTLGDPVLAAEENRTIYAELDRWAAAVKAAGITKLNGDIVLCGSNDRDLRHPDWPQNQHDRWYAAPAGRLNFHNNCLDVTFEVAAGTPAAKVLPASRFIRVVSDVRLDSRHLWSLRAADDLSTVTVRGTVRRATTDPLSVAVDRPGLLLGRVLADRLVAAGVELAGGMRQITPAAAATAKGQALCRTATPLAAVLRRANKRSLNMAAECAFLRAGDGTWDGSARLMTETLAETYELPAGSIAIRDGGGLSRHNAVTPQALTKVLVGVLRQKGAEAFLASLPAAGVDGSLADRLAEPRTRGRVLAKTGYIYGASCLSGYVLDGQGTPALAFAVLVRGVPAGGLGQAKALQDDLCRTMVDWLDAR